VKRSGRRAAARAELADELDRLAAGYRSLVSNVAHAGVHFVGRKHVRDLALGPDGPDVPYVLALGPDPDPYVALILDQDFTAAFASDINGTFARRRTRELAEALDFARNHPLDVDCAQAVRLVHLLEKHAHLHHAAAQVDTAGRWDRWGEATILACLAQLLPSVERARFVAEQRGNLGGDVPWWEHFDHLFDVTIKMPRYAWELRRGGWRERA
jgi:hypothetical protein